MPPRCSESCSPAWPCIWVTFRFWFILPCGGRSVCAQPGTVRTWKCHHSICCNGGVCTPESLALPLCAVAQLSLPRSISSMPANCSSAQGKQAVPQAFRDQALVRCSNEADALGASFTLCHRVEEVENGTFGGGTCQEPAFHLPPPAPVPKSQTPLRSSSGLRLEGPRCLLHLLLCFSH